MKKTTLFFCSLIALYSCGDGATTSSETQPISTPNEARVSSAAPAQLAATPTAIQRPAPINPNTLKSIVDNFIEQYGNLHDAIAYCMPTSKGNFFYIASGNYPSGNYKLGVVDENNKMIIPTEFDRINNLGAVANGHFEVVKGKKKGLYNLEGKEVLPPRYDGIYPYVKNSPVIAQIREGNKYGWVDADGQTGFEMGSFGDAALFQNPMEGDGELLRNWEFDVDNPSIHFAHDILPVIEGYPDEAQGIIFMPSYLKDLQLAEEDISSYSPAVDAGANFGVDDFGINIDETKKINNTIWAFVSSFWESGIDGRDYMYEKSRLVTTDQSLNYIDGFVPDFVNTRMCNAGINIRFLDGGLVEMMRTDDAPNSLEYSFMPVYSYFEIQDNGTIKKLESNRCFDFTKYVKIDERYFGGCFERPSNAYDAGYDPDSYEGNMVTMEHLSIEDLDIMRNEIFADYGRKFTTAKWQQYFSQQNWYNGQFDNVDDKLTEIDKHNINVILEMKKKMEGNEQKFIKKELTTYVAAG